MNITLYDAANDLATILDQVDPDTGELPEGFESARALVERKGASVAAWIAQREMEAEAIEARLREVQMRVKAMRGRAEHLRVYMADCMRNARITSIESDDKLLRVRLYPERDEAVDVYDESLIPGDLCVIETTLKPSRTSIKEAIKAGRDVQGARIVKRDRLVIG